MTQPVNLQSTLIWQGLLNCDRETLSIFIALFEDSSGLTLLSDKLKDKLVNIKEKVQVAHNKLRAAEKALYFSNEAKDNFSKRIESTAAKINKSDLSDEELKTALWEYLLSAFELSDDNFMLPRDIERHCVNIAECVTQNVSSQQNKKSFYEKVLSRKKKNTEKLSFEEAIEYLIAQITEASITQDKTIASKIEKKISKLDNDILEQSGASNLTNEAIRKALITSGSLLGLMGGVQAAGFSAYILAAQASAIIPFIGGQTLTSLLFVVTSPLFVLPAIIVTGHFTKSSLEKSIKQSFATTISALLVMRGMIKKPGLFETEYFLSSYRQNIEAIIKSKELKINLNCQLESVSTFIKDTDSLKISGIEEKLLLSTVEIQKKEGIHILKTFPAPNSKLENLSMAGVTFADFIYDISAIDPHVVEATDFARKAEISDSFEFACFSETLSGISEASLRGHQANLMGYTAERLVASQLVKDGHIVEIPNSASQPGYDLLVDGNEFQVKCIKVENFNILEEHFNKYPDTPIFANSEIAAIVAEKNPVWAELVFTVEGYTHEKTNNLLTQSIEAGQNLNDYEILSSVAIVSSIHNVMEWKKGEQSFQSATFNIFFDSISRAGTATVGGAVGSGVGMILFGPAGAYIFGGLASVFGATQGHHVKSVFDKVILPEREDKLKSLADNLLERCNMELLTKIKLVDEKMSIFTNGGIASYVRYRLIWEKIYFHTAIRRHEDLIQNQRLNGTKKVYEALKLASESTIHPYCLQEHYKEIANTLNEKVDRLGSSISTAKKVFSDFTTMVKTAKSKIKK